MQQFGDKKIIKNSTTKHCYDIIVSFHLNIRGYQAFRIFGKGKGS